MAQRLGERNDDEVCLQVPGCEAPEPQFPSITDSVQSCALWYSSSALARPRLLVEEYTWREKQEGWRETSKMSLVLGCLLSVKAEAHCGAAPIEAPSLIFPLPSYSAY